MMEIRGRAVSLDDPDIGKMLARAYASGIRPHCLCRSPGVEMYIARFGAGYHVKRMPNSGQRHDVRCSSFDPPPSMSGIGPLLGSAICPNVGEGITTLKLGFAMSKVRIARKAPSAANEPAPSVKAKIRRMSLRAILHYLLDLGGLNRWSPPFERKRHWDLVREKIMVAGVGNVVAGEPLVDRLYLPESFSLTEKDRIVQRRQCQFSQLASSRSAAAPLMLLLGEVKGFDRGRAGMRMLVKHMADAPFDLPGNLYLRLQRRFEAELSMWNAIEASRLLVAATFGVGTAGVPGIADLTLMVTDRNWLGFDSVAELTLIDKLIQDERCFVKPLRYDAAEGENFASAVLLDAGDPVPLHIVANGDDRVLGHGCATLPGTVGDEWTWVRTDAMPSLPSLRNRSAQRIGESRLTFGE